MLLCPNELFRSQRAASLSLPPSHSIFLHLPPLSCYVSLSLPLFLSPTPLPLSLSAYHPLSCTLFLCPSLSASLSVSFSLPLSTSLCLTLPLYTLSPSLPPPHPLSVSRKRSEALILAQGTIYPSPTCCSHPTPPTRPPTPPKLPLPHPQNPQCPLAPLNHRDARSDSSPPRSSVTQHCESRHLMSLGIDRRPPRPHLPCPPSPAADFFISCISPAMETTFPSPRLAIPEAP